MSQEDLAAARMQARQRGRMARLAVREQRERERLAEAQQREELLAYHPIRTSDRGFASASHPSGLRQPGAASGSTP